MKEETKKDVNKLLSKLEDNSFDKEIDNIRIDNPVEDLKLTLFRFFSDRLNKIQEEESFKRKIRESLERKIEDDELSISQLTSLYRLIYSETTVAIDSLLSIFKPSQSGAVSPLLEQKQIEEKDEEAIKKAFEKYSSEELQKINTLMQLLKNLPPSENK